MGGGEPGASLGDSIGGGGGVLKTNKRAV